MQDSSRIWSQVEVAGHECRIYEPNSKNSHCQAIIYLHDVDEIEDLACPEFWDRLDCHGYPMIAPQTGRSWWNNCVHAPFDTQHSAEKYVVDCVMQWMADRWNARPPMIGLCGVGMGGQGALRLAYKYPDLFPVAVGISPAIDFYERMEDYSDDSLLEMYADPEQARQDTATLHIHPLNWPRNQFFCCDPEDNLWWNSSDRLRMKLSSLGVPFDCDLETSTVGRAAYLAKIADRAIDFLETSLEKERLRLPVT